MPGTRTNGRRCIGPLLRVNTEVAALLIEKGANVNARGVNQKTPLHWAAFAGNTEVAALLIEKGADVNARDVNQKTPLDWAVSQGNTEVAALLVEKGADVNGLNGKH